MQKNGLLLSEIPACRCEVSRPKGIGRNNPNEPLNTGFSTLPNQVVVGDDGNQHLNKWLRDRRRPVIALVSLI